MGSVFLLQAAQCRYSEQWFHINWSHCSHMVRSLQNRIVKSVRDGAWRKAKRLCYLLIKSFAARALAVKRVTENKGKKTAGIDGKVWTSPSQKMRAIETLFNWHGYRPKALKRLYIPKKDKNQTRPLSIPTMEDRARQALYMYALQPIAETQGDKNSYGFRNKRRCADANSQLFQIFRLKGSSQWILEGDIKGFFDNISFDWILENIPMNKKVLRAWLNCGFLEEGKMFPTTAGVPQGGIISPVIGNMVLDGLEAVVRSYSVYKREHGINFVRYADDFIITASSKEVLTDKVLPIIKEFLTKRGLTLSEEKTRITRIEDGFDFLGQNIRKFDNKYHAEPSKGNIKAFYENVRNVIKSCRGSKADKLIKKLNPVVRGWANYHKYIQGSRIFAEAEMRSEERRVGKECRSRWSPYH